MNDVLKSGGTTPELIERLDIFEMNGTSSEAHSLRIHVGIGFSADCVRGAL